jgi:hypothetical protein
MKQPNNNLICPIANLKEGKNGFSNQHTSFGEGITLPESSDLAASTTKQQSKMREPLLALSGTEW